MRDKVMGKINVSYEGLISSRATGEAARNGRYQDDSSRSGITPGLIEFISLDDDPSGISDSRRSESIQFLLPVRPQCDSENQFGSRSTVFSRISMSDGTSPGMLGGVPPKCRVLAPPRR